MSELGYTTKKCKSCGETKHVTEFYGRAASKDGLAYNCSPCSDEVAKRWNQKHKDKRFETRRSSHLRRNFGITLEQYRELLLKQDESCAICKRHISEFNQELAVDHNHTTGEIRGLLCTNCNYRLVAKHTDSNLLRTIADYLDGGTGWVVPERPKKRVRRVRRKNPST